MDELLDHFGQRYGAWLHNAAWGRDDRPIITSSEPVTVSRETTFERNLHAVHDKVALGEIFTRLCEQVAADLQRKGYAGKTVGIKLRDDHFKTSTRNHSLSTPTSHRGRQPGRRTVAGGAGGWAEQGSVWRYRGCRSQREQSA